MSFENLESQQLSPVERSIEEFLTEVDTYHPELLADEESTAKLLDRKDFAVIVRREGIDVDFEDWDNLTDIEFLRIAKYMVSKRGTHEV